MSADWRDVLDGKALWSVTTGDCLASGALNMLPDRCAAHVITDPPYEPEAHNLQRRTKETFLRSGYGDLRGAMIKPLDFEPISEVMRDLAAWHFARIASRWILVFCQAEAVGTWRGSLLTGGATWKRSAIWLKRDGQPQLTGDRPGMGYESIACAHADTGRSVWNAGGKKGVYDFPTRNERERTGHLTQKPIALMESLLRDFTDPGDLVVDPFCGSGSTGVAARKLGRRFIGFELMRKWAAIASKRIGETSEQPDLLDAEAFFRVTRRKREQTDLFAPEDGE